MSAPPGEIPAVILCGGRATRMGALGERTPKALLDVGGRPILWYILGRLYLAGLRRFVLPVGHLGAAIADYAGRALAWPDCSVTCVDTGADTPISARIARIRRLLPGAAPFLLANGDGVFDFDIAAMIAAHRRAGAAASFATVETVSRYGLVLVRDGRACGFERNARVAAYRIAGADGAADGHVYAGICVLASEALDGVDLARLRRFEAELFPRLIARERTLCFPLAGFWHAIDTPKDLAEIAGGASEAARAAAALRARIEAAIAEAGERAKSHPAE